MSIGFDGLLTRLGRKGVAQVAGILILAVGLSWAGMVWVGSDRGAADDLSSLGLALSPQDSAKYQRDVEIYYGKLGLLTDKWTRDLEKLGHGKPLAGLIAAGSIAASAACFFYGAHGFYRRQPR